MVGHLSMGSFSSNGKLGVGRREDGREEGKGGRKHRGGEEGIAGLYPRLPLLAHLLPSHPAEARERILSSLWTDFIYPGCTHKH